MVISKINIIFEPELKTTIIMIIYKLNQGSASEVCAQYPSEGTSIQSVILESISMGSDEVFFDLSTIPDKIEHGDRLKVTFFVRHRRDNEASEYRADIVKLNDIFLLVEIYGVPLAYSSIAYDNGKLYGLKEIEIQ